MKKSYRVVRPDRYLHLEPVEGEVEVLHGDALVARSVAASYLHEGARAAVVYLPYDEVGERRLRPNPRRYECRWKGPARYFDVLLDEADEDGPRLDAAAWQYDSPPDELAALAPLVAFDPTRFSVKVDGQTLPIEPLEAGE